MIEEFLTGAGRLLAAMFVIIISVVITIMGLDIITQIAKKENTLGRSLLFLLVCIFMLPAFFYGIAIINKYVFN